MISHGTLLGWLRHCDFLPHTHDLDFAAPFAYFSEDWLRLVYNLSQPQLALRFGKHVTWTLMTLLIGIG